jgi:ADP-ribose pyrophosphatase YjhB (NUDIX family)
MIRCDSIFGNQVFIAKEKLTFRPSVYVVLISEGKILLVHNRRGSKLALPGGGIEIGEPISIALRREVKNEIQAHHWEVIEMAKMKLS